MAQTQDSLVLAQGQVRSTLSCSATAVMSPPCRSFTKHGSSATLHLGARLSLFLRHVVNTSSISGSDVQRSDHDHPSEPYWPVVGPIFARISNASCADPLI